MESVVPLYDKPVEEDVAVTVDPTTGVIVPVVASPSLSFSIQTLSPIFTLLVKPKSTERLSDVVTTTVVPEPSCDLSFSEPSLATVLSSEPKVGMVPAGVLTVTVYVSLAGTEIK